MRITVKLFAYFRDNRFREKVAEYPKGTTVADIIRSLEIDARLKAGDVTLVREIQYVRVEG